MTYRMRILPPFGYYEDRVPAIALVMPVAPLVAEAIRVVGAALLSTTEKVGVVPLKAVRITLASPVRMKPGWTSMTTSLPTSSGPISTFHTIGYWTFLTLICAMFVSPL